MSRLSIIGHFGIGKKLLNGQTIKTKIISDELEHIYGKSNVTRFDTHGGIRYLPKMPFSMWRALTTSQTVIMMPAHKGLKMMTPLLYVFNKAMHRQLIYVVIGGWLPSMLKSLPWLCTMLKKWDGILVETKTMQENLQMLGLTNVYVMPNCKQLCIVGVPTIKTREPIQLCTFSRVMKEKGIEDAISAVTSCNKKMGRTVYELDIYGQVDRRQQEWFDHLINHSSQFIHYKGCVDYDKSVEVLKEYFALLFPTYYAGEGFAGTIIDAFAAGLPVIASDWHDNANIVKEGFTGYIIPAKSPKRLSMLLEKIADNTSKIQGMRANCTAEAYKYLPQNVIQRLTDLIDNYNSCN